MKVGEMVNFIIDGKKVEAKEGATVLQVARNNGIVIPTGPQRPHRNAHRGGGQEGQEDEDRDVMPVSC